MVFNVPSNPDYSDSMTEWLTALCFYSIVLLNTCFTNKCILLSVNRLLLENGKGFSALCPDQTETEGSPLPKGYLQALDSEGKPLCLSCQQPTAQLDHSCQAHAWDTRFCSLACQEDFSIRSSHSYIRTKVFEVEHGICQFCHQNAHDLYLNIRDAPKSQRKKLLESSWMSHLPLGQVLILLFEHLELISVVLE